MAKPREGMSRTDPCVWSGRMLIQSKQYVEECSGNSGNLALYRQIARKRAPGIEPGSIAWKAMVLPLNYARRVLTQSSALTCRLNKHTLT